MSGYRNLQRAELYQRADYYAWATRRGHSLPGADPITGAELTTWKPLDRAISRAAYTGMARACFAAARALPNPLRAI